MNPLTRKVGYLPKPDSERLAQMEREIQELRAEVKRLKERPMRLVMPGENRTASTPPHKTRIMPKPIVR